MHVERRRLLVLLNALYDEGIESIPVEHPCDEIGELVRIEPGKDGQATVRVTQGTTTYRDNRETIPAKYGEPAYEDLPDAETYTRAAVASGHVDLANLDAVEQFVQRYGYPDLEAGHEPVVLGVDANVFGWRLPEVLDIDSETGTPDAKGRAPTTGYALATGVKEELDWHYEQHNTHELTAAFGEAFARLDRQPAGSNREGFLGLYEYRRLLSERTVDVVQCDRGDQAIVRAYRDFNDESRKRAILLSNDRGFVDRAIDTDVPAQHVEYPVDMPRERPGTWTAATELLYYLSILFGVLELPKVTLFGVWNGKHGRHWQHERIDVNCRSPNVESRLQRDMTILDSTDRSQ